MTLGEVMVAFLGISYSMKKRKESPIEPFKRTLELANVEYEKATVKLLEATEELAKVTVAKDEKDAKS